MGGKRDTAAHIDIPMTECTVELDGKVVLEDGKFLDERLIAPLATSNSPNFWPVKLLQAGQSNYQLLALPRARHTAASLSR
jgi:hypothetical protein